MQLLPPEIVISQPVSGQADQGGKGSRPAVSVKPGWIWLCRHYRIQNRQVVTARCQGSRISAAASWLNLPGDPGLLQQTADHAGIALRESCHRPEPADQLAGVFLPIGRSPKPSKHLLVIGYTDPSSRYDPASSGIQCFRPQSPLPAATRLGRCSSCLTKVRRPDRPARCFCFVLYAKNNNLVAGILFKTQAVAQDITAVFIRRQVDQVDLVIFKSPHRFCQAAIFRNTWIVVSRLEMSPAGRCDQHQPGLRVNRTACGKARFPEQAQRRWRPGWQPAGPERSGAQASQGSGWLSVSRSVRLSSASTAIIRPRLLHRRQGRIGQDKFDAGLDIGGRNRTAVMECQCRLQGDHGPSYRHSAELIDMVSASAGWTC